MKKKPRRQTKLKLRNCAKCHRLTDADKCEKCGSKTYPNSWIKRFPRLPKRVRKAKRKDPFETPSMRMGKHLERKRLRKPFRGGLPQ